MLPPFDCVDSQFDDDVDPFSQFSPKNFLPTTAVWPTGQQSHQFPITNTHTIYIQKKKKKLSENVVWRQKYVDNPNVANK